METGESNPLSIQSDNFNIALANSYHLSIQLGLSHFSYCLLNTTTFTYDYAKKYSISSAKDIATEITEIIKNDAIINLVDNVEEKLLIKPKEDEWLIS